MQRTNFLAVNIGLVIGLYALLTCIPFIDPLWTRVRVRYNVLLLLRDFVLGFLLFMFLVAIYAGRDGHLSFGLLGVTLGILFALIGNYLPRVPQNWFFGIRTPWTLSSEVAWKKSHVVGGWMFMATGIGTALLSPFGIPMTYTMLPGILLTVIIAGFIYPYMVNRRLGSNGTTTRSS
jgi:uncharacterized membrane protein